MHSCIHCGGRGYITRNERHPIVRKVYGHRTDHRAVPINAASLLMEHELYNLRFLEQR